MERETRGHEHPLGDPSFTQGKNRRKRYRTAFEIVVLVFAAAALIQLFFSFRSYEPFADDLRTVEDGGFIALSYTGVERRGDMSGRIGREELRAQLAELRRQGYVTITQQDILDYYRSGRPLPPRALYLMFEDGRRDTAVFAQEIAEDLNLKATMMTYPEKFTRHDAKFLKPKDLRDMEESGFWEMGTNGYRISYINVSDRYGNFLGELDPLRFEQVRPYLGRRYNHYLMDYIRDADGVPVESERHMKERVSYDYMRLRDVYEEELGYLPMTYVLLHAHTGKFGNNPQVSAVNERWIRELFPMNFNREGFALNRRDSSLYDLTRMQPQPYWPVNHLLMRIRYDTDEDLAFVEGTRENRRAWETVEGALELHGEDLLLTTLPEGCGRARLREVAELRDLHMETELCGNAFGAQQIFLRSTPDCSRAICVQLVNNCLIVQELQDGAVQELYREKVSVIRGEHIPSVEEDRRDAMVCENETFARYAPSSASAKEYIGRAEALRDMPALSVADGAAPYDGIESFHRRAQHHLTLQLRDAHLTMALDGQPIGQEITVQRTERGGIFLGASWQGEAWSQRNLADDVYDGVFRKVRILTAGSDGGAAERVLYTSAYTGWEKARYRIETLWQDIVELFLDI